MGSGSRRGDRGRGLYGEIHQQRQHLHGDLQCERRYGLHGSDELQL